MSCEKNNKEAFQESFSKALRERLEKYFQEGYQIEMTTIKKNNGVLKETLLIRAEKSECVPSFYLDELYTSYCNGEPIDALVEHIAEITKEEARKECFCPEKMMQREWYEERLFLRLVNFEKNREQLEEAVYVKVHDLAAVFYVVTEIGTGAVKSFRLPKGVWEREHSETAEEYYDTILKNTRRLFPEKMSGIEECILRCMGWSEDGLPEEMTEKCDFLKDSSESLLYVLTNQSGINGAAAILYEGMEERLKEKFPSGFFMIPSSIHEVLLLEGGEKEEEELNRMVKEINESRVVPEDVLSDHVYYFSSH